MNQLIQPVSSGDTAMVDPKLIAKRINLMQLLMKTVMRENVHYGTIPGCSKPSLWLPGSQVLKVSFKIGTRYQIEDLGNQYEKRFRVVAEVFDQQSGSIIGYGVGECSSDEEKYAWRKAQCDEEYDATPESDKRIKYQKGRNNTAYTVKQIRTNPADVSNTILKMAAKRADIHGTINATGASDVFAQDIEDLPEGYEFENNNAPASSKKPNITVNDIHVSNETVDYSDDIKTLRRPNEEEITSKRLISEKQGFLLYSECKKAGVEISAIAAAAKVENIFFITWQKSCKTNFETLLTIVRTKPNSFDKFSKKVAKETKSMASESTPNITSSEEFVSILASLAMRSGINVSEGLKACCGVDDPRDVLPNDQSMVIDWFNSKLDQPQAEPVE